MRYVLDRAFDLTTPGVQAARGYSLFLRPLSPMSFAAVQKSVVRQRAIPDPAIYSFAICADSWWAAFNAISVAACRSRPPPDHSGLDGDSVTSQVTVEPSFHRCSTTSVVIRRIVSVALAAGATLILLAPAARAALFLIFETKSYQPEQYVVPHTGGIGSPGDVVRAHTAGRGAVGAGEVMPTFLSSDGYPSNVDSARELEAIESLTPIGKLRADAKGKGRLSFETPNLPPGDYEIVLYCPGCAQFSMGRNVVAVAPFRIPGKDSTGEAGIAETDGSDEAGGTGTDGSGDPPAPIPWAAVALTLFVLSAAWLLLAKRDRGGPSLDEPEAP